MATKPQCYSVVITHGKRNVITGFVTGSCQWQEKKKSEIKKE
jgi:hypothetical protein